MIIMLRKKQKKYGTWFPQIPLWTNILFHLSTFHYSVAVTEDY